MIPIRIDNPKQCSLIRHEITGDMYRLHSKLNLPALYTFVEYDKGDKVYDFNGDLCKQYWSLPDYGEAEHSGLTN